MELAGGISCRRWACPQAYPWRGKMPSASQASQGALHPASGRLRGSTDPSSPTYTHSRTCSLGKEARESCTPCPPYPYNQAV